MPALLPHQPAAIRWLASRDRGLLALSPGLGKTIVAIRAAQLRRLQPLTVVCPLSLLTTWQRELARWWPDCVAQLITYDRFRTAGLPAGTRHVIFDESVLLKNREAQRTKRAALAKTQKPLRTIWMLSGSPTTRYHDDLWAQLHILDRKKYASYWTFARRYCLIKDSVWGSSVAGNVPRAERMLQRECRDELYSYSYADLAREFPEHAIPEWDFENRRVPLAPEHWKLYAQMQQDFLAQLPDGSKVLAPNALAQFVHLLQLATGPGALYTDPIPWNNRGGKVSAALDLLDQLPQPVLYWTNFINTAQLLGDKLKCPVLTGNTRPADRTAATDALQSGKLKALVLHPGVARFGLTLTAARSAIYVERSFNGDDYYQSLHRLRRIGTTEPPRVVHLIATGPEGQPTVDASVHKVLDYRKRATLRLTTDLIRSTTHA